MTLPSCWKQGFSIVKTSNEQNERSLHKAKLRKCPQLEIECDPLLCHPGDLSEMTDFTLKSLSKDTKSRPQRLHDEAILHDKTAGAHETEHAALPIPGFSGGNASLKIQDVAGASTILQALALTNCEKAWTTPRIGAASLRRDSKVGPPVSTSQESISRHPIFTAYLKRALSISAPNTTVKIATTGGEAPQSKIDNMYHNTVKEHGDPHTLILLLEISHAWTSTTHLKAPAQAKAAISL
jgi:hypothetical protein